MFVIKHKKLFISISVGLVALSVIALIVFKLNFGIDFKGGSLEEVSYAGTSPNVDIITNDIHTALGLTALVQPTGSSGLIVKTEALTDAQHSLLLSTLSKDSSSTLTETSFDSIGPSVGTELKRKSITALILVCIVIVLFITYAFRKVSKPIASWKYGLIAIGTLLHDVMIPIGVFTVIAHYLSIDVDTLFIVAILTILGLSVSDTIVVFDRIRENLRVNQEKATKEPFDMVVGKSINQTFTRSINTSLTVIMVLLCLVFLGPESTRYFAIMLTAGMFFGTYSSIFLASPLLVVWEEHQRKNK